MEVLQYPEYCIIDLDGIFENLIYISVKENCLFLLLPAQAGSALSAVGQIVGVYDHVNKQWGYLWFVWRESQPKECYINTK